MMVAGKASRGLSSNVVGVIFSVAHRPGRFFGNNTSDPNV